MYLPCHPPNSRSAFWARCILCSLLLSFVLGSIPALLMAAAPKAGAQPASQEGKAAPQKSSKKPAKTSSSVRPHLAGNWAFGKKSVPVEQVWTQGMAPQALREAKMTGLKNKALKNSVKAPAVPPVTPPAKGLIKEPHAFPPQPVPLAERQQKTAKALGVPLGENMRLRGEMDSTSSSWHNTNLKKAMRVDQDLTREETNVIGAYADIEAGEDLTFSAGPELSHTKSQSSTQGATHGTETGLGLGFHLKWDF